MKRITRDVHPSALRHLLERPRAYLAFAEGNAVDAAPVAFRFRAERYYVGVGAALIRRGVVAGARVTLLLDAGWYWYELQSLRLRGIIRAATPVPAGVDPALTWFEVEPRTLVAWDYGSLREVEADAAH
jgi:hypothetical protein